MFENSIIKERLVHYDSSFKSFMTDKNLEKKMPDERSLNDSLITASVLARKDNEVEVSEPAVNKDLENLKSVLRIAIDIIFKNIEKKNDTSEKDVVATDIIVKSFEKKNSTNKKDFENVLPDVVVTDVIAKNAEKKNSTNEKDLEDISSVTNSSVAAIVPVMKKMITQKLTSDSVAEKDHDMKVQKVLTDQDVQVLQPEIDTVVANDPEIVEQQSKMNIAADFVSLLNEIEQNIKNAEKEFDLYNWINLSVIY